MDGQPHSQGFSILRGGGRFFVGFPARPQEEGKSPGNKIDG